MSYASGISGVTCAMDFETIRDHGPTFVRCWLDAYHSAGGPKLDPERMMLHYRLNTLVNSYNLFGFIAPLLQLKDVLAHIASFKDAPRLIKTGILDTIFT